MALLGLVIFLAGLGMALLSVADLIAPLLEPGLRDEVEGALPRHSPLVAAGLVVLGTILLAASARRRDRS